MNQNHTPQRHKPSGFWASLFKSLLRDIMFLVMAFVIGTLALGVVCLYYGFPLALSIIGGIAVLGFALVLKTDTIFD